MRLIKIIGFTAVLVGILLVVGSFPFHLFLFPFQQNGAVEKDKVHILEVYPKTPASQAGLKEGDYILEVNDIEIITISDFIRITEELRGKPIDIKIERLGEISTFTLTPRENFSDDKGRVGAVITDEKYVESPKKGNMSNLVFRSYLGEEKLPINLFFYQEQTDRSFARLRGLIFGTFLVIVGIGIIKLRKWSVNAYLVATIYNLASTLLVLFSATIKNNLLDESFLSLFLFLSFTFIILATNLLFALHLKQNKNLFK